MSASGFKKDFSHFDFWGKSSECVIEKENMTERGKAGKGNFNN